MRRLVLLGLALVALLGGLAGLRFGRLDPAEAVSRAAAVYMAETGGAATDCTGRPEGRTIRVTCAGAAPRVYSVDRWGLRPAVLEGMET
ncbi:hypothetical protein [Wenxinia saemankumensis]|uniref:Uncharacterized protein n=1 Tax=Wenxinia saemankumensis TaxID=1447782 RepID=A0A1M6GAF7_9RHOB|nr:hypothetical protein [Wenxinia saemankumensis]SHJ06926.1 hypothetical protein SAMN05444417_2775 [Wenxinia saemankumensis]